jgi:pyruvate ferredoxin oxidoreductase beta subunit
VAGTEPLDLARKIEKAKDLKGSKLFIAFSPCPTGWHFEPAKTVEVGKLAVKTGVWPLKEYIDGKVAHTKVPLPKGKRPLVEEYLKIQGRFAHLFSPTRNEKILEKIQAGVDAYWESIV